MLITISSDNPQLASLLRKNPDSFGGMQLREIKNGVGIGRVVSPTEYHLVFQDTKYSFCGDDRSNQIDYQSYCNPRVFLTLASTFLRPLLLDREAFESEEITWLDATNAEVDAQGSEYTLVIENVFADGFSFNRGFVLEKYFDGVSLERKEGNLFRLTVKSPSVFRTVNLAALVCVYLTTTNKQPWFVNKDIARKYIRIIKNLSPVPYFVLYLFARTCLPSKDIFEALRPELEDAFEGDVSMTWGNTQRMRVNSISDTLIGEDGRIPEKNVIEVGCGELDYPRALLSKITDEGTWTSVDKDDYSHLVPAINRRHNTDRLSFKQHGTFSQEDKDSLSGEDTVILMVEVIEHMPYEEAVELVRSYLDDFIPNRVVITTPNFDFNKYFAIEGFRHDDHDFELNPESFEAFIDESVDDEKYIADFFGIGDKVENSFLSLGVLLQRID